MAFLKLVKKSNLLIRERDDELMQSGLDSWQAAEVLSVFLVTRGYGVNSQQARDAVLRMDGGTCSYECMQVELERVALVM